MNLNHSALALFAILSASLPLTGITQVYEKIYSFADARLDDPENRLSDGFDLQGGLVQGRDGDLYGTTAQGGIAPFYGFTYGTVFKITQSGNVTHLVDFTKNGTSNKGEDPSAALIVGSDGFFYGTTYYGGVNDLGTIFRMTPSGVLTTLIEFSGNGATNKGSYPLGALVQGSDGNFYGTTSRGGSSDKGTIFRLTLAGALTTIVEFTGNGATNKGSSPLEALVSGTDGAFYGTTFGGGANGLGTVFKVTPSGILETLVHFTGNGTSNKGSAPRSALLLGSDGKFYGTTSSGGVSGFGTIFRTTKAGELTTLVEFTGNGAINKGSEPYASLIQSSDGSFYGTTRLGGATNQGTVFKMSPTGSVTTLVEFTGNGGTSRGMFPVSELLHGRDGNFYGTTYRTVFRLAPDGTFTSFDKFPNQGVGLFPSGQGRIIDGGNGRFFGTRKKGYTGFNQVFRITSGGALSILGNFAPSAIARGNDGDIYGTTSTGGAYNSGTAFKMTPSGAISTLLDFT